ncbi:hypothetical protein GLYMA_18G223800v4 [Glycine max]|uniref:phosphopantothenoylcysteine decarboxylase n=1 Tax=Glycine max TaxID=3847 RepID=K7MU24_SOYBN|nr:hypothetical protein GYH30_050786 [Glycine max]KRH00617.1 hypothetical protein GLYMA_18G223800v4 [Glycine max]
MDCSNPAITKAMSEGVRLHTVPRMPRILLAACGCIDALKFRLLCQEFSGWAKISVVFTKSSLRFIDTESLFPKGLNVYRSNSANELLQWADIMVIAPLSAHTLAKIVGGICDDLLTRIVQAWDRKKPFYVAPSMHLFMWKNPFTERHLKCIEEEHDITIITRKERGSMTVIEPQEDEDKGEECEIGAMVEPSEISYTVKIAHEIILTYYPC